MKMSWLYFVICCLYSATSFAQNKIAIPADVLLSTDSVVVPPAYFMVNNSYKFIGEERIDSLKFISPNQFSISKDSSGIFTIYRQLLPMDEYRLPSDLQVQAIGHKGSKWNFRVPVKVYPEVLIEFSTDGVPWILKADSIYEAKNFNCQAKWDYPSYTSVFYYTLRFRGVFSIDLMCQGNRIDGRTGWYDSQDFTKTMEIPKLPSGTLLEVVVRDKHLSTLAFDQFPHDFRKPKVELSAKTLSRLKLVIP